MIYHSEEVFHSTEVLFGKPFQRGDLDELFLSLTQKFTPEGKKPFAPPCKFTLHTNQGFKEHVTLIERAFVPLIEQSNVPMDVVFVVGHDKVEVHGNRAILSCQHGGLKNILANMPTRVEWPDFDPETVRFHIDKYLLKYKKPPYVYEHSEEVKEFREFLEQSQPTDLPQKKKAKAEWPEHPALDDVDLLDSTFLVGPDREEVKVCGENTLHRLTTTRHRFFFF